MRILPQATPLFGVWGGSSAPGAGRPGPPARQGGDAGRRGAEGPRRHGQAAAERADGDECSVHCTLLSLVHYPAASAFTRSRVRAFFTPRRVWLHVAPSFAPVEARSRCALTEPEHRAIERANAGTRERKRATNNTIIGR